jgi:hypothetical protein
MQIRRTRVGCCWHVPLFMENSRAGRISQNTLDLIYFKELRVNYNFCVAAGVKRRGRPLGGSSGLGRWRLFFEGGPPTKWSRLGGSLSSSWKRQLSDQSSAVKFHTSSKWIMQRADGKLSDPSDARWWRSRGTSLESLVIQLTSARAAACFQ